MAYRSVQTVMLGIIGVTSNCIWQRVTAAWQNLGIIKVIFIQVLFEYIQLWKQINLNLQY